MRGDTRSLIHGIINLIVPFFIYDLASLLVGAITAANYDPWLAFWPMTILLWLPFVSDAVCVVVAAVRFQRRGRTRALLGLIFSVSAEAKYRRYFRALPEHELSEEDMLYGQHRDITQLRLELFILIAIIQNTLI